MAQLEAVPPVVAQFEVVPPIVVERSFEGARLQPGAADTTAADIVIRTINIAAVAATLPAAFIVAVRSHIVAVRSQEVALLPEAEAH
ncbi:MAG: hypothetical protein ACJ8F2_07485, partial [Xanthobacteraceae bacterium]